MLLAEFVLMLEVLNRRGGIICFTVTRAHCMCQVKGILSSFLCGGRLILSLTVHLLVDSPPFL